ncbi:hypothetical protein [Candidatus Amarolinea dominans]|uniref:hypothetical protein n=1 Tax=Candidatus Amarolinea dominans TaxID=3140696 RepID=UPI0031374966|nr:hypothetical protein [Anaerolineae bacterium]
MWATIALVYCFDRVGHAQPARALLFGGAWQAAPFLVAGLSKRFPSPALLLVAFALLMLIIGGLMLAAGTTGRRRGAGGLLPGLSRFGGAGGACWTGILGCRRRLDRAYLDPGCC